MRKKTLKLLAVIIQTSPERLWELQECNSTPPERFSHQPFYCSHWAKMWFRLLLPRDAPSTDFSHVGNVFWSQTILICPFLGDAKFWSVSVSAKGVGQPDSLQEKPEKPAQVEGRKQLLGSRMQWNVCQPFESLKSNLSQQIYHVTLYAGKSRALFCLHRLLFQSRDFPCGTGGSNFCYSKL